MKNRELKRQLTVAKYATKRAALKAIIVDLNALGLIPQGLRPPSAVEHAHIIWNYTSWLDVLAAIFAAWLLFLHFTSRDKQVGDACH